MSKRILYVIDSLKFGGAEMLLLGLLDAARDRGCEAHVAYFTPGPLEARVAERDVGMTRLSTRGLRDPRALARCMKLIRDWRPDIVHSHLIKSDLVGQTAARLSGVPRIITLHNTDPWREKKAKSLMYRTITAGADACIGVSDRVANHVARTGGFRAERIETIVNGIDLHHFDPARTQPLDLARYGVQPGAKVVAVIGSLTPQKDHENFLRSAAILAQRVPQAVFLVVGEGPLGPQIEAQARGLGLGPERLILTGAISRMRELLAALDVMVVSSAWEGLPMVLLEGMAMQCAVASTDVGGIPDVLEDGRSGRLVPAHDPEALAQAVAGLLADPAAAARLGGAARDTVVARFSAEVMRERIFALYDSKTRPRPGAHRQPGAPRLDSPN
ncbi:MULTISPECIES: glycosyltransferase [unclassified Salipiger]|uniref:glycosyltransferase n=1 Tax=unclassified Salipiger TaxID=2640570 RepID=UPI0013B7B545|nr:glycosyltransferase [Salipiger sp. PrR003]NDW33228.1 glycosyltransferase [Salipiger sp. PrR007]